MKFSSFLNYLNSQKDKESEYQCVITEYELKDYVLSLEERLMIFYYLNLFEVDSVPSYSTKMLDYHFSKYSGEKSDFLYFVSYSIEMISTFQTQSPLFFRLNFFKGCDRKMRARIILEWVEKKSIELQKKPNESLIKDNLKKEKITKKEIALLCIYRGRPITRDNATEIAVEYGGTKAGKLYQDYIGFIKPSDRTNVCYSKIKQKHHLELLNKVIAQLGDEPCVRQAIAEKKQFCIIAGIDEDETL